METNSQNIPNLPILWFGFAIAILLTIVEVGEAVLQHGGIPTPLFVILWIGGISYWLFCVYKIHQALAQGGAGGYPISPGKAACFHLIPFYNLYWIFHWPNQLARFVNARRPSIKMAIGWAGFFILLGLCIRLISFGLSLIVMFGVLLYIQRKVAAALRIGETA